MILLHKRPDLSTEQFNQHWHDVHRPLLLNMPGIQQLVLNGVAPDPNGGAPLCDGIVEAWWASAEAMQASFASPEGQAASADAPGFVDAARTQLLIVDEDVARRA